MGYPCGELAVGNDSLKFGTLTSAARESVRGLGLPAESTLHPEFNWNLAITAQALQNQPGRGLGLV